MCLVRTPRQMQQVIDSLKVGPDEITAYPLLFPLDGRSCPYRISSGFGMRVHPLYEDRRMHAGIDIAAALGAAVYAAGDGVVVRAGYDKGYGWVVEIQHRGGFITRYAHLSKVWLSAGDSVVIGEHLGNIGRSGMATGYHLHFEVRKDGRL
mgnify:FL=1